MSVRRRIVGAIGSNLYGFTVTLVSQVATVPVLLGAWGPALYGEWLMVSAVPAYLAMSDFGLGTVLGNEMTISAGRGDKRAALSSFASVSLATLGLGLFGLFPLALALAVLPLDRSFGLTLFGGFGLSAVVALLIVQVWLNQLQTVFQAGLRCSGYYALGTLLANTIRLAEFAALLAAATMGSAPPKAAAWMVFVRFVGTTAVAVILRVRVPWLKFGFREARLSVVRRMLRPGLLFATFPIANALNLQTPLLIIGTTLGAEAAALFSTTRTLTRVVQQLMSVINASVWPEMSLAFGEKRNGRLRRLFRNAIKVSLWASVAGVAAIVLAAPTAYRIWTSRTIQFDQHLLNILSIVMLVNVIWYTASVALIATNQHSGLAKSYLIVNLALPVVCWGLNRIDGIDGAAASLLFGEVLVAVYVIRASVHAVGDSIGSLFRYVFNPLAFR